ncbi:MAG: AAA family ATPase [Nocardioidaceae bacterium]|nr:AAA family ATPase [Nocardioidaceae bacterium]
MTLARPGHQPDPVAASLVDRVTAAPARLGRTRLVAVDGPAGSGKTTLAASLDSEGRARGLDIAVVHLDDMYAGWETDFDELASRVLGQLLMPLLQGETARWQRYDWEAEAFNGWEPVSPPDVLVLDGCGSGSLTLASFTSLLVWVEAPPEVRIERGVARDGEQVLPHWLAWMEHEQAHFAANRTRQRAGVRLPT